MSLRLNELQAAPGARSNKKRVGRGIGSGSGKTAGRGHKGQKSRSGGYNKVGFEGGQMPLQRRLPKRGFRSSGSAYSDEIRLHELSRVNEEVIDLAALRKSGLINASVKQVKVIASGSLDKAVTLRGLSVTRGAKAVIESLGGKIEA